MTKLILVNQISTFLLRYVIELENEDSISFAEEDVVMDHDEHLREFSQKHLGTQIASSRELDKSEYLKLFDQDNSYLSNWPINQKLQFINKKKR